MCSAHGLFLAAIVEIYEKFVFFGCLEKKEAYKYSPVSIDRKYATILPGCWVRYSIIEIMLKKVKPMPPHVHLPASPCLHLFSIVEKGTLVTAITVSYSPCENAQYLPPMSSN
jgi:hypothetical protein